MCEPGIIEVTCGNIASEHICCAIGDKNGENCAAAKKKWMTERFSDGLVFKKLDVRGKVFIEYMPAERAWVPIDADRFMHINCFWVAGKFQGQGHASRLLEECVSDAASKGMAGLTVLSSDKKRPFLTDGAFLKRRGFKVADRAAPFFELLYLPFANAPEPRFNGCAKKGLTSLSGIVIFYSNQCPYAEKYAKLAARAAEDIGKEIRLVRFSSAEEARLAPSSFTSYSLFCGGKFVTNEILSGKKFLKFLESAD